MIDDPDNRVRAMSRRISISDFCNCANPRFKSKIPDQPHCYFARIRPNSRNGACSVQKKQTGLTRLRWVIGTPYFVQGTSTLAEIPFIKAKRQTISQK
jgi:hypothetical protein